MAGSVFLFTAAQPCVTSLSLPSPSARAAPPLASGAPSSYFDAEDLHAWRWLFVTRQPAHRRHRSKATSLGAQASVGALVPAKARASNLSWARRRPCVASHCHPKLGVFARWQDAASALAPIAGSHSPPSIRPSVVGRTLLSLQHAPHASRASATPACWVSHEMRVAEPFVRADSPRGTGVCGSTQTLGEQPTRLPILSGESPLSVNCPDLDG